jgi:hypothetical protein
LVCVGIHLGGDCLFGARSGGDRHFFENKGG